MKIAFTGHRDFPELQYQELLNEAIRRVCSLHPDATFLCGMAVGFDLCAGECVIQLRHEFPKISLIAVIPSPEQSKFFTPTQKERYDNLLSLCSDSVTISDHYTKYVYILRNKYLVDNADHIVAFHNGDKSSGTASTIKYATKKRVKIENIFIQSQLSLDL